MKGKRQIACLMLGLILLVCFLLPVSEAEAGANEMLLDTSTLDDRNWSNTEEDVIVEDGALIFPESSTEYTRFISKSAAKKESGFSQLATMSASVTFSKLPAGKTFIMALGMSSIEALPSEPGNVEVTFSNQNGIKMGIVVYDGEGNAITVANAKNCGMTLKRATTVKIEMDTDSTMKVSVNGKNFYKGSIPVSGEGRVGFLQTGSVEAKIENLEVVHYKYDRPENVNISEDFEKGDMDASVLTAKMLGYYPVFPMGQKIEEYNGNQVLMFRNTNQAYIGTMHQYSNFEITFDVPYIQTQIGFDESGTLIKRKQGNIMISFGGEQADPISKGWTYATDAVVFTNYGVVFSNNYQDDIKEKLTKNPFAENGRPFSIKVSVVDSVVTAGIKWMEEEKFETVLTYKVKGGMPLGYVHIWASQTGYMAIDNLKVTNLDQSPNLVETEFESGKYDRPEDAGYHKMERVYQTKEQEASKNDIKSTWYLLIPSAGILAAGSLLTSYIVACKRRKSKKEETTDEI